MAGNRKNIGKRLRFAVMDRDGFRCRYCGAHGPGVVLHIDHVLAVSNGGTNDEDNLVTACLDCNLGKAARSLTSAPSGAAGPIDCPFAEGWPNDIEDPVYFANAGWVVSDYGLEGLVRFYPIEASRLGEVRLGTNLSDWCLHLAEKEDVAADIDSFLEAFARALVQHKIRYRFDLDASKMAARSEAAATLRDSGL